MHEPCPESSKLALLLAGEPADDLINQLVEHLNRCPACMEHLARLNENQVVFAQSSENAAFFNSLSPIKLHETFPLDRLKATPSVDRHHKIGPFRIIRKLGEGGMGQVYECLDERLGRRVAVKWIKPSILSPKVLEHIEREARIHARLTHPNIVALLDFNIAEGFPYIVMELVQGGTLRAIVREEKLNPYESATLMAEVAQAIHAAHGMGVAHLDLKPANILLSRRSESISASYNRSRPWQNWMPKVTDFGLSKSLDSVLDETGSLQIHGTPLYMAPEQLRGRSKLIGPPADIYAIGAIIYELLTGRVPFSGQDLAEVSEMILNRQPIPPREIQASVPLDIQTICLKCLEKDPRHRYASAEELAEDLNRFTQNRPILARPVGLTGKTWRMARRNPLAAGLILSTILSITMLTVGSVLFAFKQDKLLRDSESLRLAAQNNERIANQRFEQIRDKYFSELEMATSDFEKLRTIVFTGCDPERIQVFYKRIIEQRFERANVMVQRADLLSVESEHMVEAFYLAGVKQQETDQELAKPLYLSAVTRAKGIASKRTLNPLGRFCALNSDNFLGFFYSQHDDHLHAVDYFQDGWDHFRIRPTELPADSRLKRFSLVVGNNLAESLEKLNRQEEARLILAECATIEQMTEAEED